jgi:hypothetical protein
LQINNDNKREAKIEKENNYRQDENLEIRRFQGTDFINEKKNKIKTR